MASLRRGELTRKRPNELGESVALLCCSAAIATDGMPSYYGAVVCSDRLKQTPSVDIVKIRA